MKTTMIKAVFVLALLASGGAITLAAGSSFSRTSHPAITTGDEPVAGNPETFYKWIQRNIHCPDFIDSDAPENKVMVWIHVNENGTIEVVNAQAADHRLVDYVKRELNGKVVKTPGSTNDFHFAIRFRKIA